jgi:hypothetical protein
VACRIALQQQHVKAQIPVPVLLILTESFPSSFGFRQVPLIHDEFLLSAAHYQQQGQREDPMSDVSEQSLKEIWHPLILHYYPYLSPYCKAKIDRSYLSASSTFFDKPHYYRPSLQCRRGNRNQRLSGVSCLDRTRLRLLTWLALSLCRIQCSLLQSTLMYSRMPTLDSSTTSACLRVACPRVSSTLLNSRIRCTRRLMKPCSRRTT